MTESRGGEARKRGLTGQSGIYRIEGSLGQTSDWPVRHMEIEPGAQELEMVLLRGVEKLVKVTDQV